MSNSEITDLIVLILKERLRVAPEILIEENYQQPLTGNLFQLNEVEMVYFLLELEQKLNRSISSEELFNYQFNSIDSIAELL